MSIQNISVLGFTSPNTQFVVKSQNLQLKIDEHQCEAIEKNPLEYLLAGFAASINAIGKIIAKEQNFDLQSIQVEISGVIETKKSQGIKTRSRSGFKSIDILIKPNTNASLTAIKEWIDELKERCPLYDNVSNNTPIKVTVVKEFHSAA